MEIILVRHAESEDNTKLLYSGISDSPLSDLGAAQATMLSRHLAKTLSHVQAVYTSPQTRALATAQATSRDLLLGEPVVDLSLSEFNFGDWDGLSEDEINSQYPNMLDLWNSDPELANIPNAELLSDAAARLRAFCQKIYDEHPEGRIVVVSHGVLIRCFLTKLLIRPFRDIWLFDIDNAGYSIIDWEKSHQLVVKINETDHLAPKPNLE